ncbi:MAG: amidohydrolase family protein [Candidatus Latescibacteria bacterium]|jgi:hypothetical protein|nr:amidohydrolase family protein [Candidatus Latescibacterota bacterium]
MEWIDVSCQAGTPRSPSSDEPNVERLVAEMDRLRIDRALVTSPWSDTIAPEYANQQLFNDLADHERLLPVPEVLPEGADGFLDRQTDAIADLIERGAVAAIAKCRKNKFTLATWCAGEMLEAMQAARLPLMVSHDEVDPDHLHGVLSDFPGLPVILQEVPRVGYNRVVYPLLGKHPQFHKVCDPPQFVHLGIEYLVNRFGPDQLLWGTRFPISEGGAAITGITYADIPDDARAAVAGGNIRRLMDEVRHG